MIKFLVGPQEPFLTTAKGRTLAWFGHVTRHDKPLQNHPCGHLGGWATPWPAEKMLDGQRPRVDLLAHVRTAHDGLPQERLDEDLC